MCDDVVKNLKIKEDVQAKMTTAEVMTTAIIAAAQYFGNFERARIALKNSGAIPDMLSKSQLNRRLHQIKKDVWATVLEALAIEFVKHNVENEFIVDSCPVYACKLARQNQTKLYSGRELLGYCAAKREYFIGFKLHLISDINANPTKMLLRPARESDIGSFRLMDFDLPANSVIFADKAYNDYRYEDQLIHEKQVHLMPNRKINSKRKSSESSDLTRKKKRRMIETLFVLAYAFKKYAVPTTETSFETPTASALRTSGLGN